MTEKEKKRFAEMADKDKQRYDKEMSTYTPLVNEGSKSKRKKKDPNAIANYASVGAWDGMFVIHKMIEATGGQKDGLKAIAAARSLQRAGEFARRAMHNAILRRADALRRVDDRTY